jgi:iron complex outermembrane receptor protein
MTRKSAFLLTTTIAAAILTDAPVQAQDATANKTASDSVADIVVTAQFKSERLQTAPLAISSVSGAALEARGVVDVVGAASLAPNVSLTKGAGVGGSFGQFASIYIRGVGQGDVHFAVEPGVGMYIDDVYYGVMSGSVLQLMDTDRVEVLRGPQGTLAGKNSLGGSIKIFSVRPGPDTNGYVELTAGDYNLVGGRAATNFTIVDDKLFARISVAGRRRDGYFKRLDYGCATGDLSLGSQRTGKDCVLGTQGGEQVWTARASLLWKPVDGFQDSLIVDTVQDTSENPALKLFSQSALWTGGRNFITGPTSYTNYENYVIRPTGPLSGPTSYTAPDTSPLDAKGATNEALVTLADRVQLTAITAYRTSDVRLSATSDASPASITDQIWRLNHKQFTQEVRITGTDLSFVDWTLGGFYYHANGVSSGRVTIPGGFAPLGGGVNLDTVFRDPVKAYSASAFGHLVWHPLSALDVITAVRYTKDGKDFTFNRYDWKGDPHPALLSLVGATGKYRGNHVDYRLGVSYRWTPDIMTYAQYSTGFKGGGINPRPFFASQAVAFAPEKLGAWEAGVKTQFFDRALTLNAAAFYNKYRDIQGTVGTCDDISPFPGAPCSATRTIGDAHVKGGEVEATLRPLRGLLLNVSAGYLDFKYTDTNAASRVTKGMTAAYNPKYTVSANAQYSFDIGTIGSLTPRVGYTYRARIQTATINMPLATLPSLGLLDAGIEWKSLRGRWSARFAVSNLTDKFYYLTSSAPTAPSFIGAGSVAPPRQFSVSVRRSF